MPAIKFSHEYPKLWKQRKARLFFVDVIDAADFNEDLLEYDTRYGDCYYPLPKEGKFLQLFFIGEKKIPFCTIRSFNPEKHKFYKSLVGHVFDVEVNEKAQPMFNEPKLQKSYEAFRDAMKNAPQEEKDKLIGRWKEKGWL